MQSRVYNNVEDHLLKFDGLEIEDVTSVTNPNLEFKTNDVDAAGMGGTLSVPTSKLNPMEITVAHNNGKNANKLHRRGVHNMDFRIARQLYNVPQSEMGYESVKYRAKVIHKSRQHGTVERGNPTGYIDVYSVIRFEEEVAGKVVTCVDISTGECKIDGVDYASPIRSILQ